MIVEFKGKKTSRIPEWCQDNPEGYCLELNTATYARLHSASFDKEGQHFKIVNYSGCSTDPDELIEWVKSKRKHILAHVQACSTCFPNGFESSKNNLLANNAALSWPFPTGDDDNTSAEETPLVEGAQADSNGWNKEELRASENASLPKPMGNRNPQATASEVTQFQRDALVKAWVLQQANGECESCEKPSPFNGNDGLPYLEVHHVRQLSNNGSDTVTNAVALCPNCHRELHYGANAKTIVTRLYERVDRLARE